MNMYYYPFYDIVEYGTYKTKFLYALDQKNEKNNPTRDEIVEIVRNNLKKLQDANEILRRAEKNLIWDVRTYPNEDNPNLTIYTVTFVVDYYYYYYEEIIAQITSKIKSIAYKDYVEVLWDSSCFRKSTHSYPYIYTIENLMRELITKFMVIRVGIDWKKRDYFAKKALIHKNDRYAVSNNLNFVYHIDFIKLSELIFEPYYKNKQSNWDRYFKDLVDDASLKTDWCDLKQDWGKLYQFRNLVAHNRLLYSDSYKQIKQLVEKQKKCIVYAINKIDDPNYSIEGLDIRGRVAITKQVVRPFVVQLLQDLCDAMTKICYSDSLETKSVPSRNISEKKYIYFGNEYAFNVHLQIESLIKIIRTMEYLDIRGGITNATNNILDIVDQLFSDSYNDRYKPQHYIELPSKISFLAAYYNKVYYDNLYDYNEDMHHYI